MSGHTGTEEALVRMANQIARFFESQGHEPGTLGVADHIASFWSPRMRQDIFAYMDAGGQDLRPMAEAALTELRSRSARTMAHKLERAGGVSVGTAPGSDAG